MMAIIRCPECNKKVSSEAINCPKCGYPVAQNYKETSNRQYVSSKVMDNNNNAKKEENRKSETSNKDYKQEDYAKRNIRIEPIEFGEVRSKDGFKDGISNVVAIDLKEDETIVGILINKEVIIQEERYASFKSLDSEQKKEVLIRVTNDIEKKYNIKINRYIIGVPNSYSLNDISNITKLFSQCELGYPRIINSLVGTIIDLSYYVELPVNRYCVALDFQRNHCEILVGQISDGIYEVISKDFTSLISEQIIINKIVNLIIDDFLVLNDVDLKRHPEALNRINLAVEEVWDGILSSKEHQILIPYIYRDRLGWKNIDTIISKDDIDIIMSEAIAELKNFLKKSWIIKDWVYTVFVFGKVGKLEIVKSLLKENISEKLLYRNNQSIIGLGIYGGILTGAVCAMMVLDTLPHTISIVSGKNVIKIIEKDTTIPTKKSMTFTTSADNQSSIKVDIIEEYGLKQLALGSIELTGLAPAQRGIPQIKITIDVETNFCITVGIMDLGTGKANSIKLGVIENLGKGINKTKKKWFS